MGVRASASVPAAAPRVRTDEEDWYLARCLDCLRHASPEHRAALIWFLELPRNLSLTSLIQSGRFSSCVVEKPGV